MPLYLYNNPTTGEVRGVIQRMTEIHEYSADGVKWERVFTVPQASIDAEMDVYDSKGFVEKTGRKRGTMADIWDRSAELSEKRKDRNGIDDVKNNYYDKYSSKRKNMKHPAKAREELINTKFKHFDIET